MGLFDTLDVAGAPEIKYEVLKGRFPAKIAEVVDGVSSKGNRGLTVKFDLDDPEKDFQPQTWFQMPNNMDPSSWDKETILYYESGDPKPEKYNTEYKENLNMVARLRKFLVDIGIPVEQMNSINPESDLVGLPVVLVMGPQKSNENFTEVKSISVHKIGSSGATAPKQNPSPAIPQSAPAAPAPAVANPFA